MSFDHFCEEKQLQTIAIVFSFSLQISNAESETIHPSARTKILESLC